VSGVKSGPGGQFLVCSRTILVVFVVIGGFR
jgi:hypothetical protein